MNTERITTLAHRVVDGFDTGAHAAITAWLEGGERIGDLAKARWDAALKQSASQLDAETKRNAQHAREVFGGMYTRGLNLTAGGASIAVDTVAQVARTVIDRATWPQARA